DGLFEAADQHLHPRQERRSPEMTVLHVIAALDARFGGPGIALAGLAKAQRDAGMQVKVVSTWVEGDSPAAADELRALGIELEYIGPARPGLRRHPQIVPTLGT